MNFDVDHPLSDFDLVMPSDDNMPLYVGKVTERSETSITASVWHVGGWPAGDDGKRRVFIDDTTDLRVYLKWDGCGHFYFGDEEGYLHICGRRSLDAHIEMLRWLWGALAAMIPRWDAEVAS